MADQTVCSDVKYQWKMRDLSLSPSRCESCESITTSIQKMCRGANHILGVRLTCVTPDFFKTIEFEQ